MQLCHGVTELLGKWQPSTAWQARNAGVASATEKLSPRQRSNRLLKHLEGKPQKSTSMRASREAHCAHCVWGFITLCCVTCKQQILALGQWLYSNHRVNVQQAKGRTLHRVLDNWYSKQRNDFVALNCRSDSFTQQIRQCAAAWKMLVQPVFITCTPLLI